MFGFSSKIVLDHLVFYVDAANTRSYPGSGSTWYDLSGNGYDVTLTNSPAFSSGTLQFRSADQSYGTTTFDEGVLKQSNELGEWTIEILFKNISNPSSNESILAGRTGCHGGIYLYNSTSDIRHAIKTTETNCWTGAVNTSVAAISSGSIHHSVFVYSGGTCKNYHNGELASTSDFDRNTYDMSNYSNTFWIGASNLNRMTNTDISYVRCYSRALNEDEVLNNYVFGRRRLA